MMFNIKKWFIFKTEQDRIEEYLAESSNLVDLERRQGLIDRGEAPWQTKPNQNLWGWV